MKKHFLILPIIFISFFSFTFAQNEQLSDMTPVEAPETYIDTEQITGFRNYVDINLYELNKTELNVPTVLEVKLENLDKFKNFAVFSYSDGIFIPYYFKENLRRAEKPFAITGDVETNNYYNLRDNNLETYKDFNLNQDGYGNVSLKFLYNEKIKTNKLNIYLDSFVSLPSEISISFQNESGQMNTILSKFKPFTTSINFPEIQSNLIQVDLKYSQPLRILEMNFTDLEQSISSTPGVRFLAKPDPASYRIYFNSDRYVNIKTGESPNLIDDRGVKVVIPDQGTIMSNEYFKKSDIDGDGIIDEIDNCISVPNPDQKDVDLNGRGDACDDFDRDGVINLNDNCPDDPNRNQIDTDYDGMGDACDKEESRITEKYPALVWGGMIFAVLIFVGLYFVSIRRMRNEENI